MTETINTHEVGKFKKKKKKKKNGEWKYSKKIVHFLKYLSNGFTTDGKKDCKFLENV